MRTLGFRTHVLLVLFGAVGVIGSLSRPWYARPPKVVPADTSVGSGPVYDLAGSLQRWVTDPGGKTGWDALGAWATALAALSALSALLALLCLLPGAQVTMRELLRYASFAVIAIAIWRLFDSPGPNSALELRLGAFIGVVAATMLFICAQGIASAPLRQRTAPARYTPPPPPVYQPR